MPAFTTTTRRITAATTALVAAIVLLLGVSISPAGAIAIDSVSQQTGIARSDGDPIEVEFTLDSGTTYYAVAVCNVDYTIGTACDGANAIGLVPVTTLSDSVELEVDADFTNVSFTGSGPGGSTSCKGTTGANCAIAVSQYTGTFPAVTQTASTTISINFVAP
jgi:hypothetical protein